MSSDVQWITGMITEARSCNPAVPGAVWIRLEELLKGKLGERQLLSGELTNIAGTLIADMAPALPKVEEIQ